MNATHATTLFVNYLNTCNAALEAHKSEFPYDKIIEAGDKLLGDKRIGVAVYKNDPKSPHDYFTIGLQDGRFEMIEHGKRDPNIAWKVSEDYLKKVDDNKQEYIEHPAQLDWDWIKSRTGIN